MSLREKSIRIFISSTFEDMVVERDVLQERVYPKLLRECAAKGWQLELVDLRWGISFDAGVQQKTMSICIEELNRCIKISPRPNFFVMLGNRYGWRPIPDSIPLDEWEELNSFVTDEEERTLLEKNYREDLNNIIKRRVLRDRTERYVYDTALYQREVITPLSELFFRFGEQFRESNERRWMKYCASATHQEIYEGALSRKLKGWQVVAFFRNISDVEKNASFCDSSDNDYCKKELDNIIDKLQRAIDESFNGKENESEERYIYHDLSFEEYRSDEYKDFLEEKFTRMLQKVIDREMNEYEQQHKDKWSIDRLYQKRFADEHSQLFLGRESEIEVLLKALRETNLILLSGASGCGKSALLAELRKRLERKVKVIYVSIGISPLSNSGRNVLISILKEFCDDSTELYTKSFDEIKHIFNRVLLEYKGVETVIIIDALDQLPDGDPLRCGDWEAIKKGSPVHLVVSQIDDFNVKDIFTYQVPPLALDDDRIGEDILKEMLRDYGRSVTAEQSAKILEAYRQGGSYPLYIRVITVIASHWGHDDIVEIGDTYCETRNEFGSRNIEIPTTVEKLVCGILKVSSEEYNHGKILVHEVISFILKSCRGVADAEILSLLAMSNDYMYNFRKNSLHPYKSTINAFPPILWTRFYYDIKNLLSERLAVGGHVLNFYHRQVTQGAKLFLEGMSPQEHYKIMSTFFMHQWEGHFLRALEELPCALLGADDIKRLIGLLTDIDFIQYSASQGLTFDILDKYKESIDKIDEKLEQLSQDEMTLNRSLTYEKAEKVHEYALMLHSRHILTQLYEFILMESYQFENYAGCRDVAECGINNRFTLQFFYNAFNGGPLHCLAEEYINKNRDYIPVLYLRQNRAQYFENPAIIKKLRRHNWCVRALDVSSDFNLGVSVDDDKCCVVWNIKTGKMLNSFYIHANQVISCRIDEEASYSLTASSDGVTQLWAISTGVVKFKKQLNIEAGFVGADMSKDMEKFAIAAGKQLIISDDFKTWELIEVNEQISSIRVCDATKAIAVGFVSGRVAIVHQDNHCVEILPKEHCSEIRSIEFSHDAHHMVVASADGYWSLWHDLQFIERYNRALTRPFNAIKITPNGKFVLTGDDDNVITLWNIDKHSSRDYYGHTKDVTSLAISPNGQRAFSGSRDRVCIEWNLATEANNESIALHSSCVYMTPPENNSVYSVSDNKVLVRWNSKSARGEVIASSDFPLECYAADLLPDTGKMLLSLGNKECLLWNLHEKKSEKIMTTHSGFVNSVRFSLDGRFAVTNGIDKDGKGIGDIICYIDICSKKVIKSYDDAALGVALTERYERYCLNTPNENKYNVIHINGAYGVQFSPDNRLIAVACRDSTIVLFDPKSGKVIRKLGEGNGFHTNEVKSVAFTPDGRRIISGSWDNSCIVWDCRTGEMLHRLEGSIRGIYAIDVSTDGHTMVSGDRGNCVMVWDIDSGKLLNRYVGSSPCNSVYFIENGFIAGFDSGEVAVVKNSENRLLRDLPYATITRRWDFDSNEYKAPKAICPHCAEQLLLSDDVLRRCEKNSEDNSYPSLELPDSAWDDKSLICLCGKCRNRVKLNPFII